jgi:molybdopterin-guanine dinucleotide biosynthesis protein A
LKRDVSLIETKDITAVILCGGKGSRFGRVEKPLARFTRAGITAAMVDHVIATLPENLPRLISANTCIEDYGARGQVVGDADLNNAEGPLLGVYSAMHLVTSPWVLVCPGDMPLLPTNWHAPLMEQATEADRPWVLHDGSRLQPLLCLIPTGFAEDLYSYLEGGNRSVHQWHSRVRAKEVLVSGADAASELTNINTQRELERLSDLQP